MALSMELMFNNLRCDPGKMGENHDQATGWVSLASSAFSMRFRSFPNFTQVFAKRSWDSLMGRNQGHWVEEGVVGNIRKLLPESS